jgi:cytoskeletal protein RodZ
MDMGSRLRTAREAVGLSVALIAQRTRVQPRIITAIEHNDRSSIPPRPYGRAFVKAYAIEVGLDPDATVRDYFGQFAPAAPAPALDRPDASRPLSPAWMALAAVLVVFALTVLAWSRGGEEAAAPESTAVGQEPPVPAPQAPVNPRPVGTVGAAPAAAGEAPAAAGEPLELVLTADADCWVSATADGRRVLYELMRAGAERRLAAAREIVVRVGNAGALRVTVNGRETGPLGEPGEVRTARFTPPDGPRPIAPRAARATSSR